MRQVVLGVWVAVAAMISAGAALAQDVWLQIEAQPSLREAEERARAYSGVFPNVHGFDLGNGWYAIVLGPLPEAEADTQLGLLKAERMIPADSFIADGRKFAGAFWPAGGVTAIPPVADPSAPALPPATLPAEPLPAQPLVAAPVAEPAPAPEPAAAEETPAETRAAEADLSSEERQAVQAALQWFGVYAGKIDGAFGSGTRKSMAAWQAQNGHEETGILTTAQRQALLDLHVAEMAALGLQTLREEEAGIEITLPTRLVAFDRYQPPFVHYAGKDGSGYEVLLISQQGDENTLFGLYDVMQTLEIVPLTGERDRKRSAFLLTGANDRIASYTQAELRGGLIRGFTLAWHPKDGAQAAKVLEAMKASFKPFGDRALDEGLGEPSSTAAADLVSGLQVRRPVISRSGFYADASGTVVTTSEVLKSCGRLTIDALHEADLLAEDKTSGLAIIKPRQPLAPPAFATFQPGLPRAGAEIAVAGYSYGDALDAPVMTFGQMTGTTGLNGEADRLHLTLPARAGDAGGPVLDTAGSVIGVLLPQGSADGRVLPDDAGFALKAGPLTAALTAAGIVPAPSTLNGAMAAEDLARKGRAMTVLVSCWE